MAGVAPKTKLRAKDGSYEEAELSSSLIKPPIPSEQSRIKWPACKGGEKELPITGGVQVDNCQPSAMSIMENLCLTSTPN